MEKKYSLKAFLQNKNLPELINNLKKKIKENSSYSNKLLLSKIYLEIKDYKNCKILINDLLNSDLVDFEAYYIAGNFHLEKKNFLEAIKYFIKSVRNNKKFLPGLLNIAYVLKENGHFIFSEKILKIILRIKPEYIRAKFNYSHILLALKRFDEGFKLYEYRWYFKNLNSEFMLTNETEPKYRYNSCEIPKNPSDLENQSVIILQEGGLGDIFHFIRYLNFFPSTAKVFFATNKKMFKILSFNQSKFAVVDIQNKNIDHSIKFALPLLSLPLFFKEYEYSQKFEFPYIFTRDEQNKIWSDKIQEISSFDKYRIGICHYGGNTLTSSRIDRSIKINYFKEIIKNTKYKFFNLSLEKNFNSNFYNNHIISFDTIDTSDKFIDTASIINNMDLILTIDTSIAHLAGALNKKTILLLNYITEWRWGFNSENTNWYNDFIILRRKKFENWKDFFTRVNKTIDMLAFSDKNIK
jgi:hypothetical protein